MDPADGDDECSQSCQEGAEGLGAGNDQGGGLAHGVVGSARVVAFGVSSVAPAGSVVGGLLILVSFAGFASPLVVVLAFVASLCCASSIAEFARRLPSAGSLYTYNSRGLGMTGGFLTGWMMIAAYLLYVPAGVALTSAYASVLVAAVWHVTIVPWALFLVIVAAVVLVAYLGIATSSSFDLLLAGGEIAVIAALAITILVKTPGAHYSAAVLSPASSPHRQLSDITNAMIYGISAFAGFEAAAALGEEARNSRRSIPAGTIAVVIVTGIFYLLVVLAETLGAGRHGVTGLIQQPSPLGYLTSRYWSPSVLWAIDLVVVLTGLSFVVAVFNAAIRVLFAMGREWVLPGSLARLSGRHTPVTAIGCAAVLTLVLGWPLTYADGGPATFRYLAGGAALSIVLIYLAVNIATIRAFRTEFRDQFRAWRHLVLPAAATVLFLFPLWGILHPRAYTLVNLLPFVSLGWLCVGIVAVGFLRAKRPAGLEAVGRVFAPAEEQPADVHLRAFLARGFVVGQECFQDRDAGLDFRYVNIELGHYPPDLVITCAHDLSSPDSSSSSSAESSASLSATSCSWAMACAATARISAGVMVFPGLASAAASRALISSGPGKRAARDRTSASRSTTSVPRARPRDRSPSVSAKTFWYNSRYRSRGARFPRSHCGIIFTRPW
jgi:amino acid transporter